MASVRLFTAIPMPRDIEEKVAGILSQVSRFREVKWVSKAQLHVTLRFIGELEESHLQKLEDLIQGAATGSGSFEAEIEGLGAFPNLNHPRVLFIPVVQGGEVFRKLEGQISAALQQIGLPPETREYHPHLTLGRVRENANPQEMVKLLGGLFPLQGGAWQADRIILFKSQLTSKGSIYTKLREFELVKG